ncbi:MAG: trigger factor [Candidatus Falkowbacteria bacterium]
MKVTRKDLEKSQVELTVELSVEDFTPYIEKGAQKLSQEVKIEGFRPGKVPYDILKQKVGEMHILEEAAHLAIHKTIDAAIDENVKDKEVAGQPRVEVSKLAPGNPLEYKVVLAVLPEIKIGEYKNLGIKQEEVKVDEKDIAKALNDVADSRAKESISEEPIKDGDKAIIDLDLFLDKVPAEDGQARDLTVMVGKDYFVPGFDKALIGAKKDEEKNFSLPFPADYHQKNFAGKMVDFKVKIKEVYNREVPELSDDLARGFGLKKLDDLKKFFSDNMEARLKQQNEQKSEIAMLDKILEKSNFGDLPESLIQNEAELIMSELEQEIVKQGGRFEDYLQSVGKERQQLMMELLPQAVKRVKSALMLREVARTEDLKITAEEIDRKIEDLKIQYKGDANIEKMIKEAGYRGYLGNILANQKVIKKLREWNIN